MIEYLLREMLLFSFRIKSKNNATRISSATFQGAETEKIRTVNRVAGFLADHYREAHSLDELSSLFFTNKYYLTRIFKQVTGFTICEYLHIQRIQKAQEFLRTSLLPITEIALLVGFEKSAISRKFFAATAHSLPETIESHRSNSESVSVRTPNTNVMHHIFKKYFMFFPFSNSLFQFQAEITAAFPV